MNEIKFLSPSDISIIEKSLGYTYKNKPLLKIAFMHSSMANEIGVESNERFEFFGDAILEFIVSEFLVDRTAKLEGDLSALRASLVSAKSLSKVIDELDLSKFLIVNKSIETANLSINIKCDLYESILASLFFDGGLEEVKRFVYSTLKLNFIDFEKKSDYDYKSPLQELLQKNGNVDIEYRLENQVGPAHNPTFTISLFVNGEYKCKASASSKKEAEQKCAKALYYKLKDNI